MKIGSKVLGLLADSVLVGAVVATNVKQVSAPRGCGGCGSSSDFRIAREDLRDAVVDAATHGDSGRIQGLVEQYVEDVREMLEP